MNALSPMLAATLADEVYGIEDELVREDLADKYKDDFTISSDSAAFTGESGAFVFIKKESAFGFGALGAKNYPGQALIVIRGTASLYDGLTDLNAGVKRFHTGGLVHQGFYYTFESLFDELQSFLTSCQQVHTFHCIGHSLGGALATLTAEWLRTQVSGTVNLYTFGSPRVGLELFASQATAGIGADNIYRLNHQTDPVAIVPTWPFYHIPDSNQDYLLASAVSVLPPWKFHMMETYLSSVKNKDWGVLRAQRPPGHMEWAIEQWLQSDEPVGLTTSSIELINASLLFVVRKVIKAAGIVLVGGFSTVFTLLDRLAYLLHNAIDFAGELSFWVVRLITRIMQALGMAVTTAAEMTAILIRTVFLRLHHEISETVRKASRALFH
ncbi:lipase family protein [Exilibacterium tricleocarpae]|uniref:Lipase family protein n=1 Tax=Exilibacterium tricleocarpae TaxID=2591008 RepID=A0A545SPY1_9GAMM|nr:lipase family protein [Exilibacterium tricleocarpae]TQV66926.1 lipase family protein [Exilibacterium tricleocarpae]